MSRRSPAAAGTKRATALSPSEAKTRPSTRRPRFSTPRRRPSEATNSTAGTRAIRAMNDLDWRLATTSRRRVLGAIWPSAGNRGADSSTLLWLAPRPIYDSIPQPHEEDVLAFNVLPPELRNLDAMNDEMKTERSPLPPRCSGTTPGQAGRGRICRDRRGRRYEPSRQRLCLIAKRGASRHGGSIRDQDSPWMTPRRSRHISAGSSACQTLRP